ncbi:GTP-binding protein [Pandoraea pnomenusa]|uniref:GTPase family protein n=1 Tax=Pandoraea pnomenusa TaxID=93220 RepID=UPI0011984269|nr:GTPase [Pandoraea pnomenusa]QDX22493.1 GTP-binding protein [Pandoraea pnomenusa]
MFDSGAAELSEKNQEQLINDISEKISKIRSYTPKVGVFGNSGVGKSSLCNALFGKDIAKIADVEACTRKPQEILIGSNNGQGGITLIDVPGIGEDPARQKEYTALYKSLAPELDLVLWAIKADDRNYASGLDAYAEIFGSEKSLPVIFVITQTDKTNYAGHWDYKEYKPGGSQTNNITAKEHDVSKRFDVSTKNIISIAVEAIDERLTGKSYNLQNLVDLVVEVLPNEKKFSFTREAKEENVSTEARKAAEKGIWDSVKDFAGEAWDTVKDKVVDALIASAPKIISAAKEWIKSWKF